MKNLTNLFSTLLTKKDKAADGSVIENTEAKHSPAVEAKYPAVRAQDDKTTVSVLQMPVADDANDSLLKASNRVVTEVIRDTKSRLDEIYGDGHGDQDACAALVSEVFVSFMAEHEVTEDSFPYFWSRFLKMAVPYMSYIPDTFMTYINESNYVLMTSVFQKMAKGTLKDRDLKEYERSHIYGFMETFYKYLLEKFPEDRPSMLALGKAYEGKNDYATARKYYMDFMELADTPYNNGLSSLLASYENEVKKLLKDREGDRTENLQRVHKLDGIMKATYEYWEQEVREAAENGSDDRRREYIAFITHFSRFEIHQNRFEHAYELLSSVPDDYPNLFRVYGELGMLYQTKGRFKENTYYDLDKAIESFCKAEGIFMNVGIGQHDAKTSEKCILVPLANTYFQVGRITEALEICNKVLLLDSREWRVKELKKKIQEQAA